MVLGVPYSPHDGAPRDVTLRCFICLSIEADEYEEGDAAFGKDPTEMVDWCGVLVDAYDQDGVCRVDRAVLESVRWEHDWEAEISIVLELTFVDEAESLETLTERFSQDWDSHNDSFELPSPWRVFVGGSCEPLKPPIPSEVKVTDHIKVTCSREYDSAAVVVEAGAFPSIDEESALPKVAIAASHWLAGSTEGHYVATLQAERRVYGFFQGSSSRWMAAQADSEQDRFTCTAIGITALLELITGEYGQEEVAQLPATGRSKTWPREDRRAAYAAAWTFAWDRIVRDEKRAAAIHLVPLDSESGEGSALDPRALWDLAGSRQYWAGVPDGIPELRELSATSVSAPGIHTLRVWEILSRQEERR